MASLLNLVSQLYLEQETEKLLKPVMETASQSVTVTMEMVTVMSVMGMAATVTKTDPAMVMDLVMAMATLALEMELEMETEMEMELVMAEMAEMVRTLATGVSTITAMTRRPLQLLSVQMLNMGKSARQLLFARPPNLMVRL